MVFTEITRQRKWYLTPLAWELNFWLLNQLSARKWNFGLWHQYLGQKLALRRQKFETNSEKNFRPYFFQISCFFNKIICEIRKLSRYNGKLRMKDLIDYGFYHLSDKKKVLKFGVDWGRLRRIKAHFQPKTPNPKSCRNFRA